MRELLPITLVLCTLLSACPDDAPSGKNAEASGGATEDLASLDTDYKAWDAKLNKLRSCGVLDQGVIPFDPQLDLRCESLCIVAASCADLRTELCDERPAKALEDCFERCDGDEITCGDGTTAPGDAACDLRNDCANGEDEKHCDVFRCKADGRAIGGNYVCDEESDCSDGSDEQGCALVCGGPRVIGL